MHKRIMGVLGATLLSVGQALAQAPAEPVPQLTPADGSPLLGNNPLVNPSLSSAQRLSELYEPVSSGQFWARGEYRFAWMYGNNLPPLVTTSPGGTPQTAAGVLGSSKTSTLFGGEVNDNLRTGIHLEMGYWFDFGRDLNLGVETGITILESQSNIYGATSDGSAILARPFFNAADRTAQSVLIAFPGLSSGSVVVKASTGNFYDVNVDLTQMVYENSWFRFDGLLGYRFVRYDEGLHITQSLTPLGAAFVPGTNIATIDDFVTHNEFNGGEFGGRVKFQWETVSLGLLAKLDVGQIAREAIINGGQTVTVPGVAPVVRTGGFYALSSNSGTHATSDWTLLPEFGFNLGWKVNSHWQVSLGYSVLWLDRIAHAADQVDFTLNPNLFPGSTTTGGPNRPVFNLTRADIWVQSLNLGIEFSY